MSRDWWNEINEYGWREGPFRVTVFVLAAVALIFLTVRTACGAEPPPQAPPVQAPPVVKVKTPAKVETPAAGVGGGGVGSTPPPVQLWEFRDAWGRLLWTEWRPVAQPTPEVSAPAPFAVTSGSQVPPTNTSANGVVVGSATDPTTPTTRTTDVRTVGMGSAIRGGFNLGPVFEACFGSG